MVSWQTVVKQSPFGIFICPSCPTLVPCSHVKDDLRIVKGKQALGCGQKSDVSQEAADIKSKQVREKETKVQHEIWNKEGKRTWAKSRG